MYLEFRCSDLGDSSWRRTLSTLASNEYKEPGSGMKLSLLKKKKEIQTVHSVIRVSRLVWHENAITFI